MQEKGVKVMPNVKNQRGEFVAEFAYNPEGEAAANKMVANNPGYTVTDARERGNIPSYRAGGPVSGQFGGETQPGGQYDPNAQQGWTPGSDYNPGHIPNQIDPGHSYPSLDSRPKKVPSFDSSPPVVKVPSLDSRPSKPSSPRPVAKRPGTVPKYGKGIKKVRRFSKGK